jgi:hypothetical protein
MPGLNSLTQKLTTWLSNENWDHRELEDWLVGYELPALGYDEEPYVWILQALNRAPKTSRRKLEDRLLAYLFAEPVLNYLAANLKDKFAYNLFYLIAGVEYNPQLAEQLKGIFLLLKDLKATNLELHLFGPKQFYDIAGAFREALIAHQTDQTFFPIWQSILRGKPSFLSSQNPFVGLRGIILMPNPKAQGGPSIDELGWGLREMAKYLETDKRRQDKFNKLISRIKEVWNRYPSWNETLIDIAIKFELPDWATTDDCFRPLQKTNNVTLAWFPVASSLRDSGIIAAPRRLEDFIYQVEAETDDSPVVEMMLARMNIVYQETAGKDYKLQLQAVTEDLMHLGQDLHYEHRSQFAEAITHLAKLIRIRLQPLQSRERATKVLKASG